MGKFLVRVSIAIVSVYFIVTLLVAHFMCIDISSDWYATLFIFIVVVYTHSEGKYHCRFMKYTADGIFLCDLLTRLDNSFNFLSVKAHNIIPIFLLGLGISISITKAFIHFYKVLKLKRYARR